MRTTYLFLISLFLLLSGLHSYSQSLQRVVSLAPSLTRSIYLLNAQHELVGCTSYCDAAEKDKVNVVASAIDVNLEKVIILKPNLVLATTITKPSAIRTLEQAGIAVTVFPTPSSFEEICSQFIKIGKLLNKEGTAKDIVNKQKLRLEQIKPTGKRPKIFFEIGAKPLFTVIPNTFMNDYITYAGGENVASDLKSGTITYENVLLKNPDVIFIVTMGIVGIEEKVAWERYRSLNAVKNNKVFIVDSNKVCSPTPVSFVDAVESLIKLINQ